eukprot:g18907.t1
MQELQSSYQAGERAAMRGFSSNKDTAPHRMGATQDKTRLLSKTRTGGFGATAGSVLGRTTSAPNLTGSHGHDMSSELSFSTWWNISEKRMNRAKSLTRDLFMSLRQNRLEEQMNPDAGLDQVVRCLANSKVCNVIDASYDCIEDLARASKKAVDSITQLTHERYKGTANIQICEVRQELRCGRPQPELFRDL